MAERPTTTPIRIDPSTVPAQRAAGWPDFHPESLCHRCGERNPRWFASAEVWAAITTAYLGEPSHAGIVCPTCATELHDAASGLRTTWELVPWVPQPLSAMLPGPHLQTIFDSADGNCLQASVATILNLRMGQVPNFALFREFWFDSLAQWCMANYFEILPADPTRVPEEKLLAFGQSPRGIRHAVVWQGEGMLHDPHPDGTGLTEVEEFWLITSAEVAS